MNSQDDSSPVFRNIEAEHQSMRELLKELHHVFDARVDPAGVIQAIGEFVAYLGEHFEHEDKDGFFEEITEVAPRLSRRVEAVSHEHVQLLATAQAFEAHVRDTQGSSSWWDEISQEFHRMVTALMDHERRERKLLREAYLDDIGTGD